MQKSEVDTRWAKFSPWLHEQALQNSISPCKGLINGWEGCLLGSGQLPTDNPGYCMLLMGGVAKICVCLLCLEVQLGAVLK